MNRFLYAGLAAALIAAVIAGGWWWQQQTPPSMTLPPPEPPVAAAPSAAPPAPAPSEPAIKYPIDALAAAAGASDPGAAPLPVLDQADAHVRSALTELLGRKSVLSWLQTEAFARKVVATVDNLARPHAAPRLWPVNPTSGRFTIQDGPTPRISPDNASRYATFVLFIESVDAGHAAATYARLYPLFQQAYEELGYPGRHFNDRLVEVIDHLLQTPEFEQMPEVRLTEVKGPVKTERPWVRYEFTDPALESLSSGQKLLLRTGPVNERRLKAKMRELRRELVSGSLVR